MTLAVTDSDGGVGTDTVRLTVGNAAPLVTLTGTPPTQLAEDQLFLVAGRVTDAPGDRIEALADYGDGTLVPLVLGPTGTFTLQHAFAKPTAGNATYAVRVLTRDGEGAEGGGATLFSVRVTPAAGTAPTATVSPTRSTTRSWCRTPTRRTRTARASATQPTPTTTRTAS